MRLNTTEKSKPVYTHNGARGVKASPQYALRRAVMSCLLWEDQFYEDGVTIADRIRAIVPLVSTSDVVAIATEARNKMKLRHAPLWIANAMLDSDDHRTSVAALLAEIIQRPDEMGEMLSMYWKGGRKPIARQLKKGLQLAFLKFNEYQLAKYNRETTITLKDILFLTEARSKAKTKEQRDLLDKLVEGTLDTPDTWETAIGSEDKKAEWTRLLKENKLPALALLRNLRNMTEAGVSDKAIEKALENMKTERVLPFRFITAARYAPRLEPKLEAAMFKCLEGQEKMTGKTAILVDVSGSMDAKISDKSELMRIDAACGLAMLAKEVCNARVFTFSQDILEVAPRRGFALKDVITHSQPHGSTYLGQAITSLNKVKLDRLIVITDEESRDEVGGSTAPLSYMINVASGENGVGRGGTWTKISGWSEAVIDYIREIERFDDEQDDD